MSAASFRSLLGLVSLLAWLGFGAPCAAEAMHQVELAPVQGYVITLDVPAGATLKYHRVNRAKTTIDGKSLPVMAGQSISPLPGAEHEVIGLNIEVYDDTISLDRWVNSRLDYESQVDKFFPDDTLRKKTFESGYDTVMGQRTYYRFQAPRFVFEDSDFTAKDFSNPVYLEYVSVFDGKAVVTFYYEIYSGQPKINAETLKFDQGRLDLVKQIASSIKVHHEELYESKEQTYFYGTPMVNLTAFNGGIFGNLQLNIPNDWIATETALESASAKEGKMTGRIVIDIAPYDTPEGDSVKPNLSLHAEGLPEGPVSSSSYLKRGEDIVAKALPGAQKVSTKDVSNQFAANAGIAHCLSKPDPRLKVTSGGVTAITYKGRNAAGQGVVARLYSAGGEHLACNYLFTASPKAFDANIEMVEKALASLKVEALGPWNKSH